jgi:RNA polymerase sigma factor (sigma-70 family)
VHHTDVLTDDQLIDKILAGDQGAFAQLVDKYKSLAYNVAYRILRHEEEAQEAAQDAFIKTYRHMSGFDRRSKFTTWFYRIVTNEALSRARRKKYEKVDISEARFLGQSDNGISENPALIHMSLAQIANKDSEMLTLFYLKELSLDEIAEMLEMTANNVKVAVHRARGRLAKKMLELLGEEVYELVKD